MSPPYVAGGKGRAGEGGLTLKMKPASGEAAVRQLLHEYGERNRDGILELLTDDVIWIGTAAHEQISANTRWPACWTTICEQTRRRMTWSSRTLKKLLSDRPWRHCSCRPEHPCGEERISPWNAATPIPAATRATASGFVRGIAPQRRPCRMRMNISAFLCGKYHEKSHPGSGDADHEPGQL